MAKCKQCGREMEFCCDACRVNWHNRRYELGDWFCIGGKHYMLVSVGPGILALVDLHGRRWKDPIKTLEAVGRGVTRSMITSMVGSSDGWYESSLMMAYEAARENA